MENIVKGRVYLERNQLIKFPQEIIVNTMGASFLVNNFVLVKKSYYTNNGTKVDNVLYEFDVNNKTDIERWLVKDKVEHEIEKYIINNNL